MLPVWMMALQMSQKKAQNENASNQAFNQANTQNLINTNDQQTQLPQFNTELQKQQMGINNIFHS